MKKRFAMLMICGCLAVSLLSLAGCGPADKAAESAEEKVAEKALGDKVEVDGDTVTLKGDDGAEVVIGQAGWPDSDLAKKIPEFTKGTVINSVTEDNTVMIFLEKVKAGDFDAYLEEIKKTYSNDVYESKESGMVTYGGNDGNGITVAVNYVGEEETVGITISKTAQ